MEKITDIDKRIFQASAVISLAYSLIFQFLIIKAFLSQDKFKIILDFNAVGEGMLEMLIVFPLTLIVSITAYYKAYKLG